MYRDLLLRFTEICKEILDDNLIGVYLHGSMAMGCFHPAKSDVDLIIVVEDNIPDEKKMRFMEQVVRLNEEAPAKGIEMSIVRRKYCKPFVYPTPFELHFSVTHLKWFYENPKEYIEKMNGTDKDLAAHFMIMNHYGIALYGAEVKSVFGEVPKADYMDSIWYDIRDAREDILSNPMYIILNLCRVSGYLKDNLILSKQAGGEWGLKNLDLKYRRLIQDALDCYETERTMEVEKEKAAEFAEYMIQDMGFVMDKNEKWLEWAVELQSIAQAGLFYGKDPFDIERYQRIRDISAEIIAHKAEISTEKAKDLFCNEIGYQTPKLDTRAAIFQEDKILLVKEKNGTWSLPGGWVDVNVSVKENTVKEVKEEAGLDVTADLVIAIQDREKHNLPIYAYKVCKVFVLCTVVGGNFEPNIETVESRYFGIDELPLLATEKNNEEQIKMCFDAYHADHWKTLFD